MIRHYSVLLQESIDALNCQSDGIYVDGTLGRGGHSLEIARRLQNGHLYAFDLDEQSAGGIRSAISRSQRPCDADPAQFRADARGIERAGRDERRRCGHGSGRFLAAV